MRSGESGFPILPIDRILRNFRQISPHHDSISQMASWLSFYRSSADTLCSLFGDVFVDKTIREDQKLAIFYVFHEMVTRIITNNDEARNFFIIGYDQFLLSAAPIVSRMPFEERSPYLQVIRIWQSQQIFPQDICERLRLLFNPHIGNYNNKLNSSLSSKMTTRTTNDLIKALQQIQTCCKSIATALKSQTKLELSKNNHDYKEIQEICINEYKESLDKITSAGILFAQSLQGEMKIFEDLKSNIERVSTDE
ncbi:hypothetical protein cand_022900 [Cryptosporidium andersoni]|uniref:CID domain-containing protein n=1 Tax=Cryptosporidium andersoni TaxID=117008 RepID=A0A1J4MU29_9CRYT|nr:hypothetical protein cand_022900 [Cryptosporidium andersoni]